MNLPLRTDSAFHPAVPEPRDTGHLEVGDGHRIWWEEIGSHTGVPVVVVHGGPGGCIRPYYRRLINPHSHRGIFFDQRGCGRSRPRGALTNNTTRHLIADMERLRTALGISKWLVVGGSWGSTLALAYAETHPEHLLALVVSGVFLARDVDRRWLWQDARAVFPEVYHERDAVLPPDERADPLSAFSRRIFDDDRERAIEAASHLAAAQGQTLDLMPSPEPEPPPRFDDNDLADARINLHYETNAYFLEEGQLLREAARLQGIPGAIIAGRADMCTPPLGAWDLARAWPDARLSIVAAAGHRWNDEVLGRVIVPEIERLAGTAGR